jgi:hypothetical protein
MNKLKSNINQELLKTFVLSKLNIQKCHEHDMELQNMKNFI